jgi:hypothetical protein
MSKIGELRKEIFIILGPVANVIKLFLRNYMAIGITSFKIIRKYAASGISTPKKVFF